MAKVLMPLMSDDARGKLGEMVFMGWRALRTVRKRTIPTQPRTARQNAVRNIVSALSRSFGALTAAQIDEWVGYANEHPKTDSLGTSFTPSGANAYTSLNFFLLDNAAAAAASPPAVAPAGYYTALASGGAPTAPANGLDVAWTDNGTCLVTDYNEIQVAGPFNSKARNPQKSDWRHLSYGPGNDGGAECNVGSVGSYFWARVRFIDATGQVTIPVSLQFVSLAGVWS